MKKILMLSIPFLGNSYASILSNLTARVQTVLNAEKNAQAQYNQDIQVFNIHCSF
jgi:hypothetical protein